MTICDKFVHSIKFNLPVFDPELGCDFQSSELLSFQGRSLDLIRFFLSLGFLCSLLCQISIRFVGNLGDDGVLFLKFGEIV